MQPSVARSVSGPLDPISEAKRQWLAHGWDEAADGMALVTSVVRVHQLLMETVDVVLRPRGLTFARYEVLRLLAFTKAGALPMAKLGSLLQVHPTSVTSAVDRLEKQGFVRRDRHAEDGRVVLATITDEGRAACDLATRELNTGVFEAPGLTPGDVMAVTGLLTSMRRSLGDHSATD